MSLLVVVKNDTEGFAFSDGAVSTNEPRMVRSDVSKILALRGDLAIAAAGGLESGLVLRNALALPFNVTFLGAAAFLRSQVEEHNRRYRPRRPGGDNSHNLGVALLGQDPGKGMRLIDWGMHTGKERDAGQGALAWSIGANDEASGIAARDTIAAFESYQRSNDQAAFIDLVEKSFASISRMFPQRIGGKFFWARVRATRTVDGTTVGPIEGAGDVQTSSLDTEVEDGATRFARTAAHSSYRPLTNPLTAHDAGGGAATIPVANFTMRVGATDVAITGSTIGSLLNATLYFVYYDDPSLAGGAVTFAASTTRETALQGSGRFFAGSVLTPSAGFPDVIGNNDGGTGAQTGAHLLRSPTQTGGAQYGTHTNPGAATDGDWGSEETYALASAVNPTNSFILKAFGASFDNFYPRNILLMIDGEAYGQLSSNAAATRTVTASIQYSTDGGSTWTTVRSITGTGPGGSATLGVSVDSVSLPDGTAAAKVQVQAAITLGGSGSNGSNADAEGVVAFYEASYSCDT